MKSCLIALALLLAVAGAYAQAESAMIQIQFDNRGSKVMSADANKKITAALAKHVFMVAPGSVQKSTGLGQSSLLNHQSVVTYVATGPTTNGKSALANCQANIKSGWLSGSVAAKEIKKATDSWAPGDSVKVQSATCAPVKGGAGAMSGPMAGPMTPRPTGRKMF